MSDAGRSGIVARRRVAIVAGDAGCLLRYRGPLLKAIAERGHQILALSARAEPTDVEALKLLGASHAEFPMKRGGLRAIADRSAIARLRVSLTGWGPNVVLGIGLKPMVMAAIAARRLETTRTVLIAPSISGLGAASRERLSFGERWLLRRALVNADALVVYNPEDQEALRTLGAVPPELAVVVQPGAGVDLVRFAPKPMPDLAEGLVFTMIATRDPAKGLFEFIEAARRTKLRVPKARFVLATSGLGDAGGQAGFDLTKVPAEIELASAGDTPALLVATHVFVLPSHSEGFAQGVAEALACGRPAITSDIAGCRGIVDERVSGVLVPPKDAVALGSAIDSFLRRPDDINWMGQAARRKAERRFDVRAVNAELLDMMDLAGGA